MKKLITLSVASLAFSAMAADFSPNIGVQQFTAGAEESEVLLPVIFDSLSQSAISAKELVATNGLATGTCLYVFQNDSYTAWMLQSAGWEPCQISEEGGVIPAGAATSGQTLAAGSAIWISGVAGKTFSIYGKVITSKTSTIVRNKINLLANPTGATVTGSTLVTKLSGVVQAKDRITPIGGSFAGYYVYNGTAWVYVNGTAVTAVDALPNLAANQGFWYVSKSDLQEGKSNTISW